MNRPEPIAEEAVQRLLAGVSKPARYTGGEVHSVVKRQPVRCRTALCFPDVYEVAESHLGLKILYDIINRVDDLAAERCYAFWPDLEARARAAGLPLWSLETFRPLCAFDLVGFTLQYELSYATLLAMLDHGGIAALTAERGPDDPFVIGGGAGACNPEPVADFFDAFLLGDGEEMILPIIDAVAEGRQRGASRAAILEALGALDGVYVPSHYEVSYDGLAVTGIRPLPGTPKAALTRRDGLPRVTRAVVPDLEAAPYPDRMIIPNLTPVHERATVEIQRGCTRACRFCQAGMITRPTRQRSPQRVLGLADELLATSGCDEVGLLSLSAGDYGPISELLSEFFRRYEGEKVNVSLPSLRTESMTPELAARIATVRKSGFTLAPEAGSERLRAVINKTNRDEDLLAAVRSAAGAGWRQLKLYFMLGLPSETDEDLDAIVDLALRARAAGREMRSDFKLTVSVSTFIPKPHTPFQWERQLDIDGARHAQQRLREQLRAKKITLRYHGAEQSFLEGVLCRGDRRLGSALLAAAEAGCRFDAWTERHDHATWMRLLSESLAPHGLEPGDYLGERSLAGLLPWSHLDFGLLDKFLRRERQRALAGEAVEDCSFESRCYACGGCDIADPYGGPKPRGREEARLRPRLFEAGTLPPVAEDTDPPPPVSEGRTRLRFLFAKRGRALHLSHLASKEIILRAVRLARMPVVFTQGFTPRPRVGFSPACPTGIESEAELFEVLCHGEDVSADGWRERVGAYLPDGISILDVESVDPTLSSVNDLIESMTYSVVRPTALSPDQLRAAVAEFESVAPRWVRVMRKKKPRIIDARTQITEAMVDDTGLRLTIAMADNGTLKVREAIGAVLGAEHARDLAIRKIAVQIANQRPKRIDAHSTTGEEAGEVLDLSRLGEHLIPSVEDLPVTPSHAY